MKTMSKHTLDTYLELPIKVSFDADPEERQTKDSPSAPPQLQINSIEIHGIEISESLFQKIINSRVFPDSPETEGNVLEFECWDSLNEVDG